MNPSPPHRAREGSLLVAEAEVGEPSADAVSAVLDAVLDAAAERELEDYAGAWVLLRSGDRPVGALDVALPLCPEAVARDLLTALADVPPPVAPVPDGALPSISVVVPTVVARVAELQRCLASLSALDYPEFEVLVVDNRRTLPADDELPALLAGHPRCRSVRAARPGISAARNAGLAAAGGEVVAFTDDDVRVDPQWLRALGSRLARHPDEDVVTGLVVPAELEHPAQVAYEAHYGGFGGPRSFAGASVRPARGPRSGRAAHVDDDGRVVRLFAVYGIGAYGAGANMAFRRHALLARGGFDLRLGTGTPARGGEDLAALVDVLWHGGSLGYEPAALVHHTHRRELRELHDQLRGNGLGFTAMLTSLVVADHRHVVALAGLLPTALLALARQNLRRLTVRPADDVAPAAAPASTPAAPEPPSPEPPSPGPTSPGPTSSGPTSSTNGSARRLVLLELTAMPTGPFAYWRSHRQGRRWATGNLGVADVRSGAAPTTGVRA